MEDYQERMREELADLDGKIGKLMAFQGTETYANQFFSKQERLSHQLFHMNAYRQALVDRIANRD